MELWGTSPACGGRRRGVLTEGWRSARASTPKEGEAPEHQHRRASGRGVSSRPRHTRPRVGVPGPGPLVVLPRDLNSSSYRACGRCGSAGSVEVAARVRMWRPVGAKRCVGGRGGGRGPAGRRCPLVRAPVVHARGPSHPRRGRAPSTELSPDVGEESSGGDTARREFPPCCIAEGRGELTGIPVVPRLRRCVSTPGRPHGATARGAATNGRTGTAGGAVDGCAL
jgi:hypothetical protein